MCSIIVLSYFLQPLFGLNMKQIKISDPIHKKLCELSAKRKEDGALIRSNLAIAEKLINDLHKREFK